jgi:hypothetical protein
LNVCWQLTSLRLSSRQISHLLSSLWVQATSAENMPTNFEAMSHTYNITLLSTRSKVRGCIYFNLLTVIIFLNLSKYIWQFLLNLLNLQWYFKPATFFLSLLFINLFIFCNDTDIESGEENCCEGLPHSQKKSLMSCHFFQITQFKITEEFYAFYLMIIFSLFVDGYRPQVTWH